MVGEKIIQAINDFRNKNCKRVNPTHLIISENIWEELKVELKEKPNPYLKIDTVQMMAETLTVKVKVITTGVCDDMIACGNLPVFQNGVWK